MGKGKLERFTLAAIADALNGSDVQAARDSLSQLVGAVVDVSGKVQKRVKRDGQCKLVIEPGASVPGFIVFADCIADAENSERFVGPGQREAADVRRVGGLFE
jgi:hypothetical protein